MIAFTWKILIIFGDVYTCEGTITLSQRGASAQVIIIHNHKFPIYSVLPLLGHQMK